MYWYAVSNFENIRAEMHRILPATAIRCVDVHCVNNRLENPVIPLHFDNQTHSMLSKSFSDVDVRSILADVLFLRDHPCNNERF